MTKDSGGGGSNYNKNANPTYMDRVVSIDDPKAQPGKLVQSDGSPDPLIQGGVTVHTPATADQWNRDYDRMYGQYDPLRANAPLSSGLDPFQPDNGFGGSGDSMNPDPLRSYDAMAPDPLQRVDQYKQGAGVVSQRIADMVQAADARAQYKQAVEPHPALKNIKPAQVDAILGAVVIKHILGAAQRAL